MRPEAGVSNSRCGHIAIVGSPNVGKSTLLNRLLGQKLSITAPKPQTTRCQILGVKTCGDSQYVFIDTPGISLRGNRALDRVFNQSASSAIDNVDILVLVAQALRWNDNDAAVFQKLESTRVPVVLAVNKIDKLQDKRCLLPFLRQLGMHAQFREIVPISARTGTNLDRLEAVLRKLLPLQEHIFPSDQLTDRPVRFLASELLREQLTRLLGQELPYALAVEIEKFEEVGSVSHIHAVIWVERPSQKGIVLGKGGDRLKEISTRARKAIEQLLCGKVYLGVWVKVREDWADDERMLRRLGYTSI